MTHRAQNANRLESLECTKARLPVILQQALSKAEVSYHCPQWRTKEFCSEGGGVPTNSVDDREQRQRGTGGGSPPSQGFWRQL